MSNGGTKLAQRVTRRIATLGSITTIQQNAIRVRFWLTIGIAALGAVIIGATHLLGGGALPGTLKWPFTIGGGFISSLATFPVKDIYARKVQVELLQALDGDFNALSKPLKEKHVEELEAKLDKMAEKMTGG